MSAARASNPVSAPAPDRTRAERLSAAHDHVAWLVDVFARQGLAPDDARGGLSAAGSRALGWACPQAQQDLRATLDGLPSELLNWTAPPRRCLRRSLLISHLQL